MINFVIALHAEAKPIIEHFSLKKIQTRQPFPTYTSQDYSLIISGIGRCNSAAATTWLASLSHSTNARTDDIWLNVGIAGHKDQPLGKLMCSHKITEQSTNKSWYPVQIKSMVESSNLLTLDQVTTDYIENSLHDMEASGFYASALRFTTTELAQCLKIVSDNNQNSIENISKEFVHELIESNIASIKSVSDYLVEISLDSLPPDTLDLDLDLEQSITQRWKFSVTQTRQLQRLLQRYSVISGEPEPLLVKLQSGSLTRAPQVLELIHNELSQHPVEIF